MIEINCTNCKTTLQIDDAFAGGVCRCRHCGTIQTVPKRLKSGNVNQGAMNQAAGSVSSSQTTLTKKPGLDQGSGTGLDDLAGIVASSGLASARLLRTKEKPAAKTVPARDNRTRLIIGIAGGLVALLLGIIIFMAVHNGGSGQNGITANPGTTSGTNSGTTGSGQTTPNPVVNTGNPTENPTPARGPNFLGQPLTERSIAYVLDRGTASADNQRLDLLKSAVVNSIKSLGPDRQFTVIFWKIDGGNLDAWPAEGLRHATPENIKELTKFMDDVYSVGQTSAPSSTEKAFQTGAEAVVLVPIKSFIEPGTHTAIVKSRGDSKAKVYCFTLGQSDIAESFRKVASDTSGTYRDVSLDELRIAGQ